MDSKPEVPEPYCPPTLQKTNAYTLYLLVLPLIAAVAGIYYYYITIIPVLRPSNFHGMLAESFLAGHTYLLHYFPTKALLALADPYDSVVSRNFAVWDASFYGMHYYLYFGPVPAFLICAPIQYFTHSYVTDPILVWGFSCIGTACVILLLTSVASQQNIASRIGLAICITAISLGTWIPFMLRRPSFYEVAVSGAYCFSAMGFLLLWRGLHSKEHMHRYMLAASLALGLAVGCRHLHLFNVFLLGFAWLLTFRSHPFKRMFYLFGPWVFCILCLMMYNYERFGDVFESGLHYQITIFNTHAADYKPLKFDKIIPNIYYYFLRPLDWLPTWTFPYIKVTYWDRTTLLHHIAADALEPTYGLFANSPFALFLFAFIFCLWHKPTRYSHQTLIMIVSIEFYMTCIIGYLMLFIFSTVRYSVDFAPWLMFLASLSYLRLIAMAKNNYWRFPLYGMGGAAACYGAFTNLMSGYCGQYLCQGMK